MTTIIDVEIISTTCQRVKCLKHGSDKPLRLYIKDGISCREGQLGVVEKVPGIFISRLVPPERIN